MATAASHIAKRCARTAKKHETVAMRKAEREIEYAEAASERSAAAATIASTASKAATAARASCERSIIDAQNKNAADAAAAASLRAHFADGAAQITADPDVLADYVRAAKKKWAAMEACRLSVGMASRVASRAAGIATSASKQANDDWAEAQAIHDAQMAAAAAAICASFAAMADSAADKAAEESAQAAAEVKAAAASIGAASLAAAHAVFEMKEPLQVAETAVDAAVRKRILERIAAAKAAADAAAHCAAVHAAAEEARLAAINAFARIVIAESAYIAALAAQSARRFMAKSQACVQNAKAMADRAAEAAAVAAQVAWRASRECERREGAAMRTAMINELDKDGYTPLCRAANMTDPEKMRALLDAGAHVDGLIWNGFTAAHCICETGGPWARLRAAPPLWPNVCVLSLTWANAVLRASAFHRP